MLTFVLWLLLLVFCWPLALLALVLYPIVWLLLLPFRLLGLAEGELSAADALERFDDETADFAAQLVAALAADAQYLDRLAVGNQPADQLARAARDR